jgi:hypothetical protein
VEWWNQDRTGDIQRGKLDGKARPKQFKHLARGTEGQHVALVALGAMFEVIYDEVVIMKGVA